MTDQSTRSATEVERLRLELSAARKRLEEEVGYYRGQVEATRKRVEAQHLRDQATEVAARRKLEDELAAMHFSLRESETSLERLQRRYDELSDQYLQQEAGMQEALETRVESFKASAQEAWRSAEEELSRMEAELLALRDGMVNEQARSRELESTLRSLQGMDNDAALEDRQEELDEEITTLKQALIVSERARIQTQRRSVRMAEKIVELEGQISELHEAADADYHRYAPVRPGPDSFHRPPPFHSPAAVGLVRGDGGTEGLGSGGSLSGLGNAHEVDLSRANAVLREASTEVGNDDQESANDVRLMDSDLAVEFLMTTSDDSLDRNKLARLKQRVEEEELVESLRKREADQAFRERKLIRMAEEEDNRVRAHNPAPAPAKRQPVVAPVLHDEDEEESQGTSQLSGSVLLKVLVAGGLVLVVVMAGAWLINAW